MQRTNEIILVCAFKSYSSAKQMRMTFRRLAFKPSRRSLSNGAERTNRWDKVLIDLLTADVPHSFTSYPWRESEVNIF